MSAAFQGYQAPVIAARGAPLAKAGVMAGLMGAIGREGAATQSSSRRSAGQCR